MASVQKIEIEGYDATFVDEVHEELKCAVCHLVLRDPIQLSECGHRFCRGCLRSLEKYAERLHTPLLCPVDREPFDVAKVFSDKGIARTIGNLKVRCSHADCDAVVDLRELEAHLVGCQHRTVKAADVMERLRRCEDNMKAKDAEIFQLNVSVAELRAENVEMRSQLASFISTSNKKDGSKKKSSTDPKSNQDSSVPKKRKLSNSTRGVTSQVISISSSEATVTPLKLKSPKFPKTDSASMITKKKTESTTLTATKLGADLKKRYEANLQEMAYLSQFSPEKRSQMMSNKTVGYINTNAPVPKFLNSPVPRIEDDPPTPKKKKSSGLLELTRLSSHIYQSKTSTLPSTKTKNMATPTLGSTTDSPGSHLLKLTSGGRLPKAKSDPILKQYGTRRAKTNAAAIIKSKYEASSTETEESGSTLTQANSEATPAKAEEVGPTHTEAKSDATPTKTEESRPTQAKANSEATLLDLVFHGSECELPWYGSTD